MEEETTGNLSRPREASPQKRPEFAAVVFQCIPETYPADAHIECRYTITPDLIPTSRDWVGLYKVGWMTTRDYYYYEWAQTPAGYEAGKEVESSILFPGMTSSIISMSLEGSVFT